MSKLVSIVYKPEREQFQECSFDHSAPGNSDPAKAQTDHAGTKVQEEHHLSSRICKKTRRSSTVTTTSIT